MLKLLNSIKNLKNTEIEKTINSRINEFKKIDKNSNKELFKELCFCILTANFNAKRTIEIQNQIGNKFLTLTESQLAKSLKQLGHRFPNTRANYISISRKHYPSLTKILKSYNDEIELREWFVKNIKGLGYKESSHFLRNIGYKNLAILDFHIIDILERFNLITRPKTITKTKYLEIEQILQTISNKLNISQAELDLYLWYLETGKILK